MFPPEHSFRSGLDSEEREKAGIAGALVVAERFGIKRPGPKSILREVFAAGASWRRTARRLRLKGATVEAYASASEQRTGQFQVHP